MSSTPIKTPKFTQAIGTESVNVQDHNGYYQIYVETSAAPTAGTLGIKFACPESNTLMTLKDSDGNASVIDLTDPQPLIVEKFFIDRFVFTLTGFDADKTCRVFVVSAKSQV